MTGRASYSVVSRQGPKCQLATKVFGSGARPRRLFNNGFKKRHWPAAQREHI